VPAVIARLIPALLLLTIVWLLFFGGWKRLVKKATGENGAEKLTVPPQIVALVVGLTILFAIIFAVVTSMLGQ